MITKRDALCIVFCFVSWCLLVGGMMLCDIDTLMCVMLMMIVACFSYIYANMPRTFEPSPTVAEDQFTTRLKLAEGDCEFMLDQLQFAEQEKVQDFNRALFDWCEERGLHYEGPGCTCKQCTKPKAPSAAHVEGIVCRVEIGQPITGDWLVFNGSSWNYLDDAVQAGGEPDPIEDQVEPIRLLA